MKNLERRCARIDHGLGEVLKRSSNSIQLCSLDCFSKANVLWKIPRSNHNSIHTELLSEFHARLTVGDTPINEKKVSGGTSSGSFLISDMSSQ